MEETTAAIKQSCEDQKKGITTFIEVILNQELGEPFRRDAMKAPVKVAFNCFMGTDLDKLVIGNCYLNKNNQNQLLKKDYTKEFELD